MGIVIAGAGSIGLLLGSYLAESGLMVTMFVRRESQAKLILKNGIRRINEDGSESIIGVNATTDITNIPPSRLWVIAVKYGGLQGLLSELKGAGVVEPVLFVQNGIGHLVPAGTIGSLDVAFASVEHGAFRMDDRTVKHNGVGMLTIGAGRGNPMAFNVVEEARSKNFPVIRHEDAEHVLMRKVLINCMINPLTAILEVKNGELLTNPSCYELFEDLYRELMEAFPYMQAVLPLKKISAVCKSTAENQSSMLSDRLAGRPMEIATIVTAVTQRAQATGKTVPLLSTYEKMLYALEQKENSR